MTLQAVVTQVNENTGVATVCVLESRSVYKITQRADILQPGDEITITPIEQDWAEVYSETR